MTTETETTTAPFLAGPWDAVEEGNATNRWMAVFAHDERYEGDQVELFRSAALGAAGDQHYEDYEDADELRAVIRLAAAAPLLRDALRALVSADSCNYWRDTMRYTGLFDAGRAALLAATGEDLTHPDAGRTNDPLLIALMKIATYAPAPGETPAERASALQTIARRALDSAASYTAESSARH